MDAPLGLPLPVDGYVHSPAEGTPQECQDYWSWAWARFSMKTCDISGAQCLRTWYFTKPLIDDGHSVRLLTLPIYNPDDEALENPSVVRRTCEGFEYQAFASPNFAFIDKITAQVAHSFKPDAIIAINMVAAWVAARLPLLPPSLGRPQWI